MPIEFNDRELNIIGTNARILNFLDDDLVPRASIYLDGQGRLNVGNVTLNLAQDTNGAGGTGGGVTRHSQLQGLGADDHQQYMHKSVARTVTARHTFNPSSAGSPFILGSNAQGQLVAGLNSDLLRGLEPSSNPGANERILKSTAAGALSLNQLNVDNVRLDGNTLSAQTGDLTLTAAGGDVVLPSAINIGADNFVSQLTGWRVTYAGEADFRYLFADELHVKAFIADIEQALAGGQIISKSVALLSRDFVVPYQGDIQGINASVPHFLTVNGNKTGVIDVGQSFAVTGTAANDGDYTVASTQYVDPVTRIFITGTFAASAGAAGQVHMRRTMYVEDLPGFANTQVFAANDWIRLRVIDRSGGGLVVADVWGTVGGYSDLSGGEQSWVFRCRDDSNVDGRTVNAGAIVLDYGQSGDGWHEITALDPDGPYAQIVTWETDPTNSANYTLRSRLGNLDGVTDSDFPSIGGWGLYSTSAYLKGDLIAAGGEVIINDDGVTINAPDSWVDTNSITWKTPGGDIVGSISGQSEPVTGDPNRIIIQGSDPNTSTYPYIALDNPEQAPTDGQIEINTNTGPIYLVAGDVRIGNDVIISNTVANAPAYRLDVQENATGYAARIFNDGNNNDRNGLIIQTGADSNPSSNAISIRDGNGDTIGVVQGNGSGGVNFTSISDERTKQDITPLDGALGKVLALAPITYRGKGQPRNRHKRPGLVAQQVRGILPDVVTEIDGDMLGIDYMGIVPYLIGAIHELNARIDELEMAR